MFTAYSQNRIKIRFPSLSVHIKKVSKRPKLSSAIQKASLAKAATNW